MKNLLFITEGWCDGEEGKGLSNSIHNIYSSFKKTNISKSFNWSYIYFDEIYIKKDIHINILKEKIWNKIKPDIIIYCLLGQSKMNPNKDFMSFFQDKETKNIIIWPDLRFSGWRDLIK